MRLGLMQPYAFPYLEYFRLINDCSLWVYFDSAQFSRSSWQNRNRILDRNKGWSYLGIPVARDGLSTTIKDAHIDEKQNWRGDILNKLKIYEKPAPHYKSVVDMVSELLSKKYTSLADFNIAATDCICRQLEIDTPNLRLSEMSIAAPEPDAPGGWPLDLCKAMGATEYRNSSGGRALYDREIFLREGIELSFHQHIDFEYDTYPFAFVPDLSIIDVLMWVDIETLKDVVNNSQGDKASAFSPSVSGRQS